MVLLLGVAVLCGTLVVIHAINAALALALTIATGVLAIAGLRVSSHTGVSSGAGAFGTAIVGLVPAALVAAEEARSPELGPDLIGAETLTLRASQPVKAVSLTRAYAEPASSASWSPAPAFVLDPREACLRSGDGYGYDFDAERLGPGVPAAFVAMATQTVTASSRRSQKIEDPCKSGLESKCAGPKTIKLPGGKVMMTGCTTISGRLPPESVKRTLQLHSGRFSACFPPSIRLTSGSVRLVIVPAGKVLRAEVIGEAKVPASGSNIAKTDLQTALDCISGRALELGFGASDGGVLTVTWPFQYGLDDTIVIGGGPTDS
jgi:hypothetical protein